MRSQPKFTTAPIGDLTPDPANLRVHPERNVRSTDASLKRFGAARSIVVDGKNVVRAGNRTLESAKAAGITQVLIVEPEPDQLVVVRRSDWSPSEATAYAIADNRTAELAEWDETALAETLRSLQSEDFDTAAVGYDEAEVDAMLDSLGADMLGEPAEDPGPQLDRAEELQTKWQTAAGQLWVIPSNATPGKEHRLLCGDSTKAEDVARVMGGEKADALIADPPYGISYSPGGGGNGWTGGVKTFTGKDLVIGDDLPFDPSLWVEYSNAVLWGANHYADRLPAKPSWLVWDKRQDGLSNDFADCEMAWCSRGGPARLFRHLWNGAFRASERGETRVHPTQKPVEVIKWTMDIIEAESVIFDPFSGSGTTFVAAEQTGRLCRGIEIAPKYVAVALERLAGMGLAPRLIEA